MEEYDSQWDEDTKRKKYDDVVAECSSLQCELQGLAIAFEIVATNQLLRNADAKVASDKVDSKSLCKPEDTCIPTEEIRTEAKDGRQRILQKRLIRKILNRHTGFVVKPYLRRRQKLIRSVVSKRTRVKKVESCRSGLNVKCSDSHLTGISGKTCMTVMTNHEFHALKEQNMVLQGQVDALIEEKLNWEFSQDQQANKILQLEREISNANATTESLCEAKRKLSESLKSLISTVENGLLCFP